ncbi:hypothetical protein URH17368_1625 [Alicyclobacillus hesperidum URH17-3-68]|uniref:Probable membrane transporter protein n=1 Tax=Alicyclobacillus hesperidum TaxID=89784 RepID=A0A1H2WZY9_9BACL|nr:sulfite exporter TauE/SafE family protein [Alicyclobacillus hesperidum]EJY55717.1 hypothetical protein URH17368_1625 [Alicyclobacillus hesperidum URH17-3-68]GLV12991.1 UPF0721 transmembrane protein [Alicyclobacillus hesperidum]SDW86152.1 hypothetical protein SAMN04489725_11761 [Alicyclobacillus hesperidum]
MSLNMFLVLLGIGFIGSMLAGMVGVGGAVVKYPLLLYIPPLITGTGFTSHEVAGMSAVQVMFASAAALWANRKGGQLHRPLIWDMGLTMLITSFAGAYGAHFVQESIVNVIYAILATIAVVIMFRPPKEAGMLEHEGMNYPRWLAILSASLVGVFSGMVGSTGSFLLMPILLSVLKIPTRAAIATSIAITFIASLGGVFGKAISGEILWNPTLVLVWASVVGAPLGVHLARRLRTRWLKALLATLIILACARTWWSIFAITGQ